jgi:hypothetical protein
MIWIIAFPDHCFSTMKNEVGIDWRIGKATSIVPKQKPKKKTNKQTYDDIY